MMVNLRASVSTQNLERILERRFPGHGRVFTNALLSKDGDVRRAQRYRPGDPPFVYGRPAGAEQGVRLLELMKMAQTESKTEAFFRTPDFNPLNWRQQLAETRFAEAFEAYLTDFGHRGIYETELASPRWREDPTYLLETIRTFLLDGRSRPPAKSHGEPLGFRSLYGRTILTIQIRAVRSAIRLRENCKSVVSKLTAYGRICDLEVARRFVLREVITETKEVFWLTIADIQAFLSGAWDGKGAVELIADRRWQQRKWESEDVPDVLFDDRPAPKTVAPKVIGLQLKGIGVSSGQATGPVRLIHHPTEGTQLRPGEVLVALSTDPAWTILFLRASAVIMETGGYLSHGAIVAREYGVPAVVNIGGVMTHLVSGQNVIVDGDTGIVQILS